MELCPEFVERTVNGQKVRVKVYPADARRDVPNSRFAFRESRAPTEERFMAIKVIFAGFEGGDVCVRKTADSGLIRVPCSIAKCMNRKGKHLARPIAGEKITIHIPEWYVLPHGLR